MKLISYISLIVLVFFLPGMAAGQPVPLSDEELDQITAGGPQVDVTVDPTTGAVGFSFDAGSAFGNGSAALSPSPIPSTLNLTNGNLTLSNFAVQNLILNMNLCVQCRATTINQLGFGLGITVNP